VWIFYLFSSASKKNYFVLFCGFCNFGKWKPKKKQGLLKKEEQASIKLANCMGGVRSEGGLEGWKIQKHV